MAAYYTDRDSSRWVEMAIELAMRIGANVVQEGTLRNPNITIGTAIQCSERGYKNELHLVAVHQFVSRLRIFGRYLEQVQLGGNGRYTLPEAHDRAYKALQSSLATIAGSGAMTRITLYDMNGDVVSSPCDHASPTEAIQQLELAHDVSRLDLPALTAKSEEYRQLALKLNRQSIVTDIENLQKDIAQNF